LLYASENGDVSDPLRIFLVDDHRLFLAGLRAELGDDFHIAGEAADVDSAIDGIRTTLPDVVLLDVHLPGGGGATVLQKLSELGIETRTLALSVSDAAEDVIGIIRSGARGYVTKTIEPDQLAEAIRRVHDGDAVFSPRLAGFVLDAFHGDIKPLADPELDQLTPREQEVLRNIASGFTYKQVASRLNVSIKTVEAHVSAVLRKLQLSSRHELTVWATNRKLI
jgi:DNA-binding NarL/FixJ family response regulator